MKLKHWSFLASVALLAACGGGKPEGDVRFLGLTPLTVNQKDTRAIQTFCPNCHEAMEVDKAKCENKKCKTEVAWPKDYRCPYCQGFGKCNACAMMEQKGDCYNCKGQGVLIYAGQSPTCPNCKGSKQCPTCKGTQKCDFCGGEGKIAKEVVKAKAQKFANRDEDALPPSDPRLPDKPKDEPKKDEGKKDDAPKDEPKKDDAPKDKKE